MIKLYELLVFIVHLSSECIFSFQISVFRSPIVCVVLTPCRFGMLISYHTMRIRDWSIRRQSRAKFIAYQKGTDKHGISQYYLNYSLHNGIGDSSTLCGGKKNKKIKLDVHVNSSDLETFDDFSLTMSVVQAMLASH